MVITVDITGNIQPFNNVYIESFSKSKRFGIDCDVEYMAEEGIY